jgi:hypothetical protein
MLSPVLLCSFDHDSQTLADTDAQADDGIASAAACQLAAGGQRETRA